MRELNNVVIQKICSQKSRKTINFQFEKDFLLIFMYNLSLKK